MVFWPILAWKQAGAWIIAHPALEGHAMHSPQVRLDCAGGLSPATSVALQACAPAIYLLNCSPAALQVPSR